MAKNREETEKKILDSVGKVLVEEGASHLGINNIARKAGVSKVLIYRYFGSYDELILKYISMNNPFPLLKKRTVEYLGKGSRSYQEAFSFFFGILIDYIEENPSFREILTYELVATNSITREIAFSREESSLEILKFVEDRFPEITFNIPEVTSIITGGIFYLIQRSRFVTEFNTMDLRESSSRLKEAVDNLVKLL